MFITSHQSRLAASQCGLAVPRALGFSLIEVMITMFILAVGLLGLAGLQARAITAEVESYSRGQALFLVNDLVNRMAANAVEVKATVVANTAYNQGDGTGVVTTVPTLTTLGTGTAASSYATCAALATISARDLCEWNLALHDIGNSVSLSGSMPGIRGCVFLRDATTREYQVDVVWQGRDAGASAPVEVTCGATTITTRRVGVSRRVRFANLTGS